MTVEAAALRGAGASWSCQHIARSSNILTRNMQSMLKLNNFGTIPPPPPHHLPSNGTLQTTGNLHTMKLIPIVCITDNMLLCLSGNGS